MFILNELQHKNYSTKSVFRIETGRLLALNRTFTSFCLDIFSSFWAIRLYSDVSDMKNKLITDIVYAKEI